MKKEQQQQCSLPQNVLVNSKMYEVQHILTHMSCVTFDILAESPCNFLTGQ